MGNSAPAPSHPCAEPDFRGGFDTPRLSSENPDQANAADPVRILNP